MAFLHSTFIASVKLVKKDRLHLVGWLEMMQSSIFTARVTETLTAASSSKLK